MDVPDREPNRRDLGGLGPQIGDVAFDPENGFDPIIDGDGMEIFEREAAQIDRQAKGGIGGFSLRPEPARRPGESR